MVYGPVPCCPWPSKVVASAHGLGTNAFDYNNNNNNNIEHVM